MVKAAPYTAGDHSIHLEGETGIGYDSNVYKAPASDYIDYAAGGLLVDPDIKSGFFIPIGLEAGYERAMTKSLLGIVEYDFDGRFYLNKGNQNADTYEHKIDLGLEHVFRKEGNKMDSLYVGPYFSYLHKLYVDRDTGERATTVAGEELSDRYSYKAYGVKIDYDRRVKKIKYGVDGKYEIRDYEKPDVFSQYDLNYYSAGGYIELPVKEPVEIKLSYKYARKEFDERPARDENGRLFPSNDTRNYTYHYIGATVKSDIGDDVKVYLDYDYTRRTDDFQGYHDYSKHKYGVRVIYKRNKIRLRGKVAYWTRVYDNAFAFEDPSQDGLEASGIALLLSGEYEITKRLSLVADLEYEDERSTDDRYAYDRYQIMAGVKWEY